MYLGLLLRFHTSAVIPRFQTHSFCSLDHSFVRSLPLLMVVTAACKFTCVCRGELNTFTYILLKKLAYIYYSTWYLAFLGNRLTYKVLIRLDWKVWQLLVSQDKKRADMIGAYRTSIPCSPIDVDGVNWPSGSLSQPLLLLPLISLPLYSFPVADTTFPPFRPTFARRNYVCWISFRQII